MPPTNDMELLREFVVSDSQEAFETLLNRHINLVYSTALRMVRDPSLAGEVTQTTFIILAKKARLLGSGTVLSGWLYRTTQFAAARALRTEYRRREREEEAAKMQTEQSDSNSMWEELAPFLDQAMAQLGETDRNAVVLRYFENKDSRDVGAALGINEAAAQKRVARAVEKMRKFCLKRGIVAPAIALTAVISANAVHAAPVTVVAGTATAVKGAGAAAATSVLVKSTLELMRWIKIKAALTAGLSATVLAGVLVFIEAPRWSQPEFGGRILSSWLARLDDGKQEKEGEMTWVSWQEAQAGRSAEQKRAADAIRAMGAPALPYLHAALTKEDGKIDWMREKLGLSAPAEMQRHEAVLALHALGPEAKPLLPQLTECLEGTNCPKAAAAVLASIGPEGWAVLTRGITSTNNNAAPCSIWALATHRAGGPEAVAALKNIVANAAPENIDVEAVWALAEICPDHNELVPIFTRGLASSKGDMRWACALALGELGQDARPAVPALAAALNDSNPKVRHDAAQALQEIDMNEAARAGVGEPLSERHIPRTIIFNY
jgi:RNA polymerase sigma factor (sigma-70 family)